MTTISKDALEKYVMAVKKDSDIQQVLNNSLRKLDPDNGLFSLMSNEMLFSIDNILTEILGKEKFEWLSWWMWETDFGTKNTKVTYVDNDIVIDVINFTILYDEFLVSK